MIVEVIGTDLPGRRCNPEPNGHVHTNVHVCLCRRRAEPGQPLLPGRPWRPVGLTPGDAAGARWVCEVTLRDIDGSFDFGGPYVLGRRGDRHLGLAWGDVVGAGSDAFQLFRGAKLRLETIDAATVRAAAIPGHRLVARLGLTDSKGNPRCATVRPPAIVWTAESLVQSPHDA